MAISEYSNPVQNSLESYVPMPLDMMLRAGQATQERYNQSQDLDSATQSGLASIEAKAPAYQQYVQTTVGNYKNDMSNLIDKYNGRVDDPQFQREQRQVINKYKNDPNWQVIKQGNQNISMDQEIAAKLRAEGKQVINPTLSFKGVDTKGNLSAYTPGVKEVNTIEDWDKALQIAHGSMQFDGKGFNTNIHSLANARATITNDVANNGPQTRDLIQSYVEQGYTPEQAKQAVLNNVSTLANKYGVVKTRDEGYFSNALQQESINQATKYHGEELQNKLDIAKIRAAALLAAAKLRHNGGAGSTEANTPYATPANNATVDLGNNLRAFVADESSQPIGTSINSQKVEGKYFQIGDGGSRKLDNNGITKQTGGFTINKGTVVGAKNIWVTENGNLAAGGKDYQVTQKIDPKTGQLDNYLGNQKVHKQTVIEYNDAAGFSGSSAVSTEDKNRSSWRPTTYYRLANRDEAITHMGADNAYYEGKNQNNSFNNMSVKVVSKDPTGNGDDIVKPGKQFSIPESKIQEAINWDGEGLDPEKKEQLRNQIHQAINQANDKGVSKSVFESLRKIASDEYHDKIYHSKVIAPQAKYKNNNKTQGAIDPTYNDQDIESQINQIGD